MEENRIPKRVLYMNLGTARLRGRPRNRWQDEVREDGRIVGGEGWQKNYVTERNGRSCWERQGIVEFCACQWNEWLITYRMMMSLGAMWLGWGRSEVMHNMSQYRRLLFFLYSHFICLQSDDWLWWWGLGDTQRHARELISGPCLGAKARFLSFKGRFTHSIPCHSLIHTCHAGPSPAPTVPCPVWKSAWYPEISELLVQQFSRSSFL